MINKSFFITIFIFVITIIVNLSDINEIVKKGSVTVAVLAIFFYFAKQKIYGVLTDLMKIPKSINSKNIVINLFMYIILIFVVISLVLSLVIFTISFEEIIRNKSI